MRAFLIAALCACALDARAQDPDTNKPAMVASGTQASGRFQLHLTPLVPAPTTLDRRYSLQSGFDAEPSPAPTNARFSLHSQLRDKSALATCGQGLDGIFANGFQ